MYRVIDEDRGGANCVGVPGRSRRLQILVILSDGNRGQTDRYFRFRQGRLQEYIHFDSEFCEMFN